MVRRSFYIPFVMLLLLTTGGCQTIQFDRPAITHEKDWLVDGYSQNRSRSTEDRILVPLEEVWEYNAAGAFGPGSPLVLDGVVLVATRKGEIHSIELNTGRKLGFKGFGEGIEGSPIIYEGHMLVASALGKHNLVSFDLKRGSFSWRNKGTYIESGMVVQNGIVVAADIEGMVRGFDTQSGTEVWSRSLGDRVSVQSALLLVGDSDVFISDDKGMARVLDVGSGAIKWETQLAGPVYEGASSFGQLIAIPTTRGTLEVLDARSGIVQWKFKTQRNDIRFGSTAISENTVAVGATDGRIRVFDAHTGTLTWEVTLPDVITAAPLITESSIFIGSMGRALYALNPDDGRIVWETTMKGRIKSSMALVDNGLLVLSEPRYVTYFKTVSGEDNESN